MINIKYFLVVQFLFSFCVCEISSDREEKLLNVFLDYYNNLPNQVYSIQDGSLLNTQQVDDSTYQIGVNLRVVEIHNIEATKLLKCTVTLQCSDDEVTVTNSNCEEVAEQKQSTAENEGTPEVHAEVVEPTVERRPVQLVNEVQDSAVTSGEQFIAIPRDQPSAPCVGCASHVNPQAAGVSDLAKLGLRHLDLHKPTVKHSLGSVLDVERQVQVVNGVRYILILSINSNECTGGRSEDCASSKICRVSILVKPWVKLPNGGNYRAILANNCTEEWHYGDNGEVLPELPTDSHLNDHIKDNSTVNPDDINAGDAIQVKQNTNLQSQPDQERILTDEEIKNIQDQIIPNAQFQEASKSYQQPFTTSDPSDVSKQHVFKVESNKHNENSIPVTESEKTDQQTININQDKKKAIDEMLDFFDFSGFKPKTEVEDVMPRIRRSYDYDEVMKQISVSSQNDGHRGKRQLLGGDQEANPAESEYFSLAEESLRKYVVDSGITHPLKVARVEKVITQVVSGSLTKIDFLVSGSPDFETIKCHSEVWEQSWLNKKQITVSCQNDGHRGKRQLIGGDQHQNPAEPQYKALAEESLRKYVIDSGITHPLTVASVEKVVTQVVSGSLTKIDFLVSGTPDFETIKCHSEVWEQSWLNKKEITVSCQNDGHRVKRQLLGGDREANPAEPEYFSLAEESLRKYVVDSGITHPLKVARVEKVITQVVSGSLTKIDFLVSGSPDFETIKCHSEVWEQSWLNKKQITVSCQNDGHRGKRQLIGGDQHQNPAEPQYKALAEESLRKYVIDSGITHPLTVASVEKVVTQVVSGSLTKIDFLVSGTPDFETIKCHSEVWEQSWLNKKEITVSCQNDGHRVKRQLLGGDREANPAEPEYFSLAEESLRKYVVDSGITHPLTVASVEKVVTQVVSGSLTKIDFLVSGTPDFETIKCHSEVWEQSWLNKKEITVSCQNDGHRVKRQLLGGDREANPAEPEYFSLAEESLRKYVVDSGITHPLKVARVEKVITQVVSGSLTKIDFLVSGSPDFETIKCHSEVWEQSWLNKKQITVSCQNDGHRGKRQLIGGDQHQNPAEPQYKALAEESLRKYVIDSGITHPLTVASVEKVVTQVVSGSLTKIDFLVSGTPDFETIKCHSEVWEQSWLNKKEITVSCQNDGQRVKRQLLGGDREANPAEPEYFSLAEESLRKYVVDSGITHPLKVARVEKVITQVVSGSLTKIDFLVSGSPDFETIKCHSEVWEQSWLNKKQITVSCQNDGHRGKRQLIGGDQHQNPAEPQYKALAEESLRKYVIDSGITHPLTVASVEKVTTQVVSGSLTKIDFLVSGTPDFETIKCHSEVWEQSWLNKKEITVSCQNDGQRVKRQLLGGDREANPAEPEYFSLAEESLRKYVVDSGITHPLKVARVEKVITQVVSGSLTKIDFLVSGSPDFETIKCHSEVWEQSWLNKKQITVSCQNDGHRGKRQLIGGDQHQNPAEPQYKALAEESLRKYVIDSGITHPLTVASVEKVVTQVVSGSLTKIDFLVSGTPDFETIKCHSEVWEQSWLNKKEITVSCQNDGQRVKRQLLGGDREANPAEPEYFSLAEESLRKYVVDSGITHPLKVARVEKVITQVVSGSLTKIDFLVSGSPDFETIKCHSEVWEQSWLNKKQITVSCQNDGHRGKRQLIGGDQHQNPAEPQYKALAEESLRKYVIDSGITHPLTVASVEKVTTQVLSGSLTKIDFLVSGTPDFETIKCHSEVWEQSWLNKKEITVSCQNSGQRAKRQIPGGIKDKNPAEPEYFSLAEESLRKYVVDSGVTHPLKVASVEKVTIQVVSGSLTKIDFLVSGSPDFETIKCHSEVWEQSWLNKKEITVSCQNSGQRAKRQIPGGIKDKNPAEPEYFSLAEESLRKYVADSGVTHPLKVASVEKVTTQVVSGSLTKIDFLVSGTPDFETIKCHSEVWEQSWLNKKEITVSCQNDGHRVKRQLLGGDREANPAEPEYFSLAEESLRKYVVDSGITHPLTVARVEKVITQVVSGSLTKIDFLVSGSPDFETIKCHSEVWEQSWLNKKQITVSCQNDGHRGKRQLIGGDQHQNPAEPQYKALAEESLRKYVIDSGITHPLTVASVEKVTTQVVSGSLTKIDFLVSGTPDFETIKCHSEVWEQSWLNKKEITVSCQNSGQRAKRQIPGGIKDKNPAEPEYFSLAEESLRKYVVDSGVTHPLKVACVEKVTTQAVAGLLTKIDFLVCGSPNSKILICHSEVWEKPWLNKKDITVSCQNSGIRDTRQILGGIKEENPGEPQYLLLAKESLRKYVVDSGVTHPLKVASVEKVTTQPVSGLLTRIDFLVSGSPDSKTIKCHSKVWEQPWLNKKAITVSCQNSGKRGKRQTPGGIKDKNPAEPEYLSLAEESLRKYVVDSGVTHPLKVTSVEKVTTQVVSGSMTRIDFLVSGSPDFETIKCHSEVWEKPWLNKKDITVSCQNSGQRGKRQIRGGIKDKNPAEPEYLSLAEESLRKYVVDSGVTHPLKVTSVEKVTTQVVSGSMTRIDFLVSGSPDFETIKCHSEVWEQPWLNKKDITVSCQNSGQRGKRQIRGGIKDKNPAEPEYLSLAEESLRKYVVDSGITHPLKVASVEKVTTQVVAGSLTRIDFLVSGSPDFETIKCHSEVWEQPWLNKKDVTVTCHTSNDRVKRDLEMHGGPSKHNLKILHYKVSSNTLMQGNGKKGQHQVDIIRGHDEEEQDPSKYEYKLLAEESLRKFDQKNNTFYHKVVEVNRVIIRVVSGFKYKIDFTAAPTACSVNVSSVRVHNCKRDEHILLYCHTDIWDRPWLKQKKIDVTCNQDDNESENNSSLIPSDHKRNNVDKYHKLAEEASEKYLTTSNRKYVHKVTEIISASEQVTNGTLTNINYSLSPTTCLRNGTTNRTSCELKHPLVVFNCSANIHQWLNAEKEITVTCKKIGEQKSKKIKRALGDRNIRQISDDNEEIQKMVTASLEKLEMQSLHRYKQRLLQINSHSTKITSGRVTTINFDVGYSSCLKYEWVVNITNCNFLEHLPRRHCVAQIWERLWTSDGKHIDVNCVDDETPLESHVEFENAEMANELAKQALKHIEAKYPHPSKQKVVRIFSLEKQVVAGIHYKMKVEVGFTDCTALSDQKDCKLVQNHGLNKFCRINVWLRPWTDHPPNFRVSCDYQDGAAHDLYHHVQAEHLFYQFLATYSPSYINNHNQMQTRFKIFKDNIKKIHEMNIHERGTATYGVTRFTDLTYEEFSGTYMGLKKKLTNENQVPMKQANIPDIIVPQNFDWRDHDAVTEVKNQGSCGSCWAFSVTGNIEGQWKMQSGQLVSLSEQELVDCDKLDEGCNGGLPDNAYRAIEQMGGLELESDYPYEGADDKCLFNKTLAKVQISSAVNITTNETGMAQWLVHNGPISIGINANAMQFYMGGISHPWKMLCNPTNLDHGVLIVGYGIKDYPLFNKKLPYWVIKNSWGKSWGEQGYYRVYRGDGTCGVNQMASSAVI